MTLTEEILTILTNYPEGYRLMRMKMHRADVRSVSLRFKKIRTSSDNTLRVMLSRLKKAKLIENKDGLWKITKIGINYIPRKGGLLPSHSTPSGKTQTKNMIIAFDIPETYKHRRNWLRIELINLGFKKLQQSVWFGPSPLPEEFIHSLQDIKILPHLKFFEAKEADII